MKISEDYMITDINGETAAIPVGQKVPWGEPLKGLPRISSQYGPRKLEGKQSFHDGIDYAVVVGTPVYSVADGYVVRVINDETCGLGVRIQHEDGTQTIYCHLSKQMVSNGAFVGAGCQIAESGNTGHSTGPHLHIEVRKGHGVSSQYNQINPLSKSCYPICNIKDLSPSLSKGSQTSYVLSQI